MKALFNRLWPQKRLCMHRWCLRAMVYDHRCQRHGDDD